MRTMVTGVVSLLMVNAFMARINFLFRRVEVGDLIRMKILVDRIYSNGGSGIKKDQHSNEALAVYLPPMCRAAIHGAKLHYDS